MPKRGSGEGTVTKRSDGRWMGRLSVTDRDGKPHRVTIYAPTQQQAIEKLAVLRQQREHSPHSLAGKDTVAGYIQRWLNDDVAINKSPKTYIEYELASRKYVNPYIGHLKLVKLTADDLVSWQAKLSRKGLSANTRLRAIRVFRNALNKAVKRRILPFNPCAALDKPKVIRKPVTPLEPEQCQRLFAECKSHRLGDLIVLAAITGMRKGELFGLEWSAVNLAEGVLVVRQSVEETTGVRLKEPKTAAGRRVITLGRPGVDALRNRLRKATEEGFEPEVQSIVFPTVTGTYLRGSNFDRAVWYPIRKAAEIPETFVFHDLRHTSASLLLAAGVDLKVIQSRLGHADFATTANVYSHLLLDAQSEATDKLDAFLSSRMTSDTK